MKAVWQLVDAILILILTYACEAWTPNKEQIHKLQTIFNEAIKTITFPQKGTINYNPAKWNRQLLHRTKSKEKENPPHQTNRQHEMRGPHHYVTSQITVSGEKK